MGKGLAWLNGEEIGRYWPRKSEFKSEDCVKECDYKGKFNLDKCDTGCGEPKYGKTMNNNDFHGINELRCTIFSSFFICQLVYIYI